MSASISIITTAGDTIVHPIENVTREGISEKVKELKRLSGVFYQDYTKSYSKTYEVYLQVPSKLNKKN